MGIKKHNDTGVGNVFDFDEIIKPYHSAGTKSNPIKMTMEGLSGALVNTNKIPADIAGAVIFQTCYDIANNGLDFKGNGTYGSKWSEFFNHIRSECIKLQNIGSSRQIALNILESKACIVPKCPSRTKKVSSEKKNFISMINLPRFSVLHCILTVIPLLLIVIYRKEIILWLIGALNDLV